jgi:hypothetical protein
MKDPVRTLEENRNRRRFREMLWVETGTSDFFKKTVIK